MRVETEELRLMRAAELFLASLLEGLQPALVFEEWLEGPAAVDMASKDGWMEAIAISRSVLGMPLSSCGEDVPIVLDREDLLDLAASPGEMTPFIRDLVQETARRLVVLLDAGTEPPFGPAWSVVSAALFLMLGDREEAAASMDMLVCRGYFDGLTGALASLGTDAIRWTAAMAEAYEELAVAFPEPSSCKLSRFLARIRPVWEKARVRMVEV